MAPGACEAPANAPEPNGSSESSNMFSPRSSAALTLSSISRRPGVSQQTLFNGEGNTHENDENSGTNSSASAESSPKDDFCPPKDPKDPLLSNISLKTRRVSDAHGNFETEQRELKDRPAPLQRSSSVVATPGNSANKLFFGPSSGEATGDAFHPPYPPSGPPHGHGYPWMYNMYPSQTPQSMPRNDDENRPNHSSGKGHSPDNEQPLPFHPNDPHKFSPMMNPPFIHPFMSHPYEKKSSPSDRSGTNQSQHSIDFQPPMWKNPSREPRQVNHLAPAHPPTSRLRRATMPMPAPVMSGGWGDSYGGNWEQPGIPQGTPFIMVRTTCCLTQSPQHFSV